MINQSDLLMKVNWLISEEPNALYRPLGLQRAHSKWKLLPDPSGYFRSANQERKGWMAFDVDARGRDDIGEMLKQAASLPATRLFPEDAGLNNSASLTRADSSETHTDTLIHTPLN